MNDHVHFIYLGGEFTWQHLRAVETARVHGAEIIMWAATRPDDRTYWDRLDVTRSTLVLPNELRDHPIQLANVKDYYAWNILLYWGGLYLDLDTISLEPVWDLLSPDADVLVSNEWSEGFELGPHYNSAVVAGRMGAPVLMDLRDRAKRILDNGETRWGACGPWLLTEYLPLHSPAFTIADFGVLSGWRDDTIFEYYDGADPPANARVIHCYSSSRPERFAADRWLPSGFVMSEDDATITP